MTVTTSLAADVAVARRALALLDLTELGDNADEMSVTRLCDQALDRRGHVAAVCVWPRHVTCAVRELDGSDVRVATVVNFPSGDEAIFDVVNETRQALADGAHEIDLVLPYKAFRGGWHQHVTLMLSAVRAAVPASCVLKVILETGELADPQLVRSAAVVAIAHGADFVKTSTGKTKVSATLEATAAMLDAVRSSGRQVGLKPSGGIRTLGDAATFLEQADTLMGSDWVSPATFRFGASGLHAALLAAIDGETVPVSDATY